MWLVQSVTQFACTRQRNHCFRFRRQLSRRRSVSYARQDPTRYDSLMMRGEKHPYRDAVDGAWLTTVEESERLATELMPPASLDLSTSLPTVLVRSSLFANAPRSARSCASHSIIWPTALRALDTCEQEAVRRLWRASTRNPLFDLRRQVHSSIPCSPYFGSSMWRMQKDLTEIGVIGVLCCLQQR